MSNFWRKADELVFVAAAIGPWAFIVAVVIIVGMVKSCIPDGVDPMDNSINKSREIIEHVMVRDSTGNGFRVVYVTKNPVTEERFREIRSRQHVREGFERLQREAPEHFGETSWRRISATSRSTHTGSLSMTISAYTTSSWRENRRWTSMSGPIPTSRTAPRG